MPAERGGSFRGMVGTRSTSLRTVPAPIPDEEEDDEAQTTPEPEPEPAPEPPRDDEPDPPPAPPKPHGRGAPKNVRLHPSTSAAFWESYLEAKTADPFLAVIDHASRLMEAGLDRERRQKRR